MGFLLLVPTAGTQHALVGHDLDRPSAGGHATDQPAALIDLMAIVEYRWRWPHRVLWFDLFL